MAPPSGSSCRGASTGIGRHPYCLHVEQPQPLCRCRRSTGPAAAPARGNRASCALGSHTARFLIERPRAFRLLAWLCGPGPARLPMRIGLETQKARTVSSAGFLLFCFDIVLRSYVFGRPCSDLLSQALRLSTIGAEEFDGRVRDGIGSWAPRKNHKVSEKRMSEFWFWYLGPTLSHARSVDRV